MEIEAAAKKYLTQREKEVLSCFLEGMSMREIGRKIGISHVMVLKIRNKIKDKYGRFNRETAAMNN
jgi:DNA-binding CsgD family transcriptional regulator